VSTASTVTQLTPSAKAQAGDEFFAGQPP
jgi:hypothetical protein